MDLYRTLSKSRGRIPYRDGEGKYVYVIRQCTNIKGKGKGKGIKLRVTKGIQRYIQRLMREVYAPSGT